MHQVNSLSVVDFPTIGRSCMVDENFDLLACESLGWTGIVIVLVISVVHRFAGEFCRPRPIGFEIDRDSKLPQSFAWVSCQSASGGQGRSQENTQSNHPSSGKIMTLAKQITRGIARFVMLCIVTSAFAQYSRPEGLPQESREKKWKMINAPC